MLDWKPDELRKLYEDAKARNGSSSYLESIRGMITEQIKAWQGTCEALKEMVERKRPAEWDGHPVPYPAVTLDLALQRLHAYEDVLRTST
jgi:hypothetical protein